ncbi:MAG: hypothetical protein VB959_12260, partial [Rhodospirillales bacterium]
MAGFAGAKERNQRFTGKYNEKRQILSEMQCMQPPSLRFTTSSTTRASLDLLQKSVREIQFPQPIENKQFLIYRVLFLFNGLAFSTSCLPTFATGLLVEDVANKRLSEFFEETIWLAIKPAHDGFWQVAKNNESMGAYGLMASARDWLRLGAYIIKQISSNKCIGKHF